MNKILSFIFAMIVCLSTVPLANAVELVLPGAANQAQAAPSSEYAPGQDVTVQLTPGQHILNLGLTADELRAQGCELSVFQVKGSDGGIVDLSTTAEPFLYYDRAANDFKKSNRMDINSGQGYFVPLKNSCTVRFKAPAVIQNIEFKIGVGMNLVSFPVELTLEQLKQALLVSCPNLRIDKFSGDISTNEQPFVVYDPVKNEFTKATKVSKYYATFVPISAVDSAKDNSCTFKLSPQFYDPSFGQFTAIELKTFSLPVLGGEGNPPTQATVSEPVPVGTCSDNTQTGCPDGTFCGKYYRFNTEKNIYEKSNPLVPTPVCQPKKENNQKCDSSVECKSGYCYREFEVEKLRYRTPGNPLGDIVLTGYCRDPASSDPQPQIISRVDNAVAAPSPTFDSESSKAAAIMDSNMYTVVIETGNGVGYQDLGLTHGNREATDTSDAKTTNTVYLCAARNPKNYMIGIPLSAQERYRVDYEYKGDTCAALGSAGADDRIDTFTVTKDKLKKGAITDLADGDELYLKMEGEDSWALRQFAVFHQGKKIAYAEFLKHRNTPCTKAATLIPGGQIWLGISSISFPHPEGTRDCYSMRGPLSTATHSLPGGTVASERVTTSSGSTTTTKLTGTDVVKLAGY